MKLSLFSYSDYKVFVEAWVTNRPNGGRGEYRRMAQHLGVSSTMMSQVFRGNKDISLEMAAELSEYFGFGEKEERYFFLLVELSRAGSHRLKEKLLKQLKVIKSEAQKISERVAKDKELNQEDKAIFYSSWVYTGLRNLVAVEAQAHEKDLAGRLQLPEQTVREALKFLIEKGLLRFHRGRYEVLAKATHLSGDDPLVLKHHQNWRIRGFQKMDLRDSENLFYTAPMSLSKDDCAKIRELLLSAIQDVNEIVRESPSETVRCLAIDWFNY